MMFFFFLQGGAVALFTGLQYDKPLAGVLCMSGYLAGEESFTLSAAAKETPIGHFHGCGEGLTHTCTRTLHIYRERGRERTIPPLTYTQTSTLHAHRQRHTNLHRQTDRQTHIAVYLSMHLPIYTCKYNLFRFHPEHNNTLLVNKALHVCYYLAGEESFTLSAAAKEIPIGHFHGCGENTN